MKLTLKNTLSIVIMIIACLLIIFFIKKIDKSNSKNYKNTGFYFDTVVTITLYGDDQKYLSHCFEICDKYDKLLDNTSTSGDIYKINENSKSGKYTEVNADTIDILNKSINFSKISDGAFDVTIGKLTDLWHMSDNDGYIPANEDIINALKTIDYKNIDIKSAESTDNNSTINSSGSSSENTSGNNSENNSVLLLNSDTKLDLGGIAKGYIADKIKDYLVSKGVKHGIINLGGNVLLIGDKSGSDYNIGIQYPFKESDYIGVVKGSDISVVTSGVYERYFYKDDVLYHHLLSTSDGYPVNNGLLSVTIISKDSADGDGYSTSAFVMGLEKGMDFIEKSEGIEAVFIDDNYKLHVTSGLNLKTENGTAIISLK